MGATAYMLVPKKIGLIEFRWLGALAGLSVTPAVAATYTGEGPASNILHLVPMAVIVGVVLLILRARRAGDPTLSTKIAAPSNGEQRLALDAATLMVVEARIANSRKSAGLAIALCLLLGGFGVHRLYLGSKRAVIMLVLGITGLGLIVTIPWALIDLFRISSMVAVQTEQLRNRYIRELAAGSARSE